MIKHTIDDTGKEHWHKKNDNGYYHYREDGGPSVIWHDGSESRCKNSKRINNGENEIIYIDIDGYEKKN